ncbi:VOC family protein [Bdellovibrionota bacterium FG-1]
MATLNHVGIAVVDLPRVRKLFSILGLETAHSEAVPEQGVNTHFIPFSAEAYGSNLELLEVIHAGSPVAKFISKRGPGLHHLSFRVESGELDALSSRLTAEGYRLVFDGPQAGAHGMRVNFIHPASADGLLIEIMEAAPGN